MDIIIFLAIMLVPFVLAKQWFFVGFLISMDLVLIAWEVISLIKTKRTISQHFRAYAKDAKNKFLSWSMLTAIVAFGWFLVVHFMAKNV